MTDDRSERLRRRRQESTAAEGDLSPRDGDGSSAEGGSGSKAQSDEAITDRSEPDSRSNVSVKEEQKGTYMYLPESQTKDLRRLYNVLKAEYEFKYDAEFEKNRHFYPLVVQFGLENLDSMDAPEIRTHLETMQ